MQRCGSCKETKPADEFHSGARRCKPCAIAASRSWYAANRDRALAQQRQRRADFPDIGRDQDLRQYYGISLSQYDELAAQQDGKCAACGEVPTSGRGKRLHVDHCHATGRVRGLLCHGCNTALGLVKERPELLVAYLAQVRL